MKPSRASSTLPCLHRTKTLPRSLVTRVLEEYRPEAASLSWDVFDALQSAVDSLVDGGESQLSDEFQAVHQLP